MILETPYCFTVRFEYFQTTTTSGHARFCPEPEAQRVTPDFSFVFSDGSKQTQTARKAPKDNPQRTKNIHPKIQNSGSSSVTFYRFTLELHRTSVVIVLLPACSRSQSLQELDKETPKRSWLPAPGIVRPSQPASLRIPLRNQLCTVKHCF